MQFPIPSHYLPWAQAGGPNECAHGYAEGIPCPRCDPPVLIVAVIAGRTIAIANVPSEEATAILRGLLP